MKSVHNSIITKIATISFLSKHAGHAVSIGYHSRQRIKLAVPNEYPLRPIEIARSDTIYIGDAIFGANRPRLLFGHVYAN